MNGTPPGTGHQLHLFGGPLLTGPHGPVRLSPHQALLLALVFGHETRAISRPQAIWLLWEEDDSPQARQKVRQLLYGIKKRLGFQPVRTVDGDSLAPDIEALPSDLGRIREALREGDLALGSGIHRQGFLSGLRGATTKEVDDWLDAKRVSLRRSLWDAAAKLWDEAHVEGDWVKCLAASEALYSLAPGSERELRKVLEARAMTGNPEGTEAAYSMFLEGLAPDEQPSPATTELMSRVRALGETAPPPGVAPSSTVRTPFVGRKDSLRLGRDFIHRVRDGGSEFAVISGESGVGKTRLLEEITAAAHLEGIRCLSARLVESERTLPLNPLIDAFGHPDVAAALEELKNPWRAVLTSVLPPGVVSGPQPPVPPIAADRASRRLFDSIALLLRELTADRPTILFLDNVQWMDDTTASALQFVQRRWQEGGLGVLATLTTPALGRRDPSVAQVSAMFTTRLPLVGLSDEEAAQLVRGVLETGLDPRSMAEVVAMGGGNPFYLTELAHAHKEGNLELPTQRGDRVTIPISLKELVEARLSPLSAEATITAQVLSVWARPARLRALGTVTGQPEHTLLAAVEELEERGVATVEDGSVSVAHDLFRAALYEGVSNLRRAFSHRAIAEYLAAAEPGAAPGELAFHFARAGEAEAAAEFARIASEEAAAKGALPEACGFLQIAIDNTADEESKAGMTADLGQMLSKAREISRAAPVLETAGLRLRRFGLIERAREMEVLRVEALSELGVVPISELLDRLHGILSEAKSQGDWTGVATTLDALLHLLHRTGDIGKMKNALEEAEDCVRLGDPRAQCLGNSLLALGSLYGEPSRALSAGREAVRLCETDGYSDLLLTAQNRLLVVLLCRGMLNLAEGRRLTRLAAEEAEKSGDLLQKVALEANLGLFFLDAGELERARAAMGRASRFLKDAEAGSYYLNVVSNLGELAIEERDYPLAQDYFTQAEGRIDHTASSHIPWMVNAGLGICALESGRLSEARVREADAGPTHGPWHFDPTIIVDFRVRYLTRRGEAETALALVEQCSAELRDRLTLAWLKLKTIEGRVARRLKLGDLDLRLAEPIALADELQLNARARILRELSAR